MPKKVLGQWTEQDKQFARNLKAELGRRGKNYETLMRKTGRSQTAVYKRYHHPGTTTVDELRIFIQEAELSENDVLDFLFRERRRNANS